MQVTPSQFRIDPNSGVPIYRQLCDQVRAMIVGGHLRPGDVLPSVRQVALMAEVNPMTVSKAYARMEAEGILERLRGQGMRVRPNNRDACSLSEKKQQLRDQLDPLIHRALQMGMTQAQIRAVVESTFRELNT